MFFLMSFSLDSGSPLWATSLVRRQYSLGPVGSEVGGWLFGLACPMRSLGAG
jgi:hypothetical protein